MSQASASQDSLVKVFEPEWGNPSLRTIFELPLPEAVSLLPATPGWWLVLIGLMVWMARLLWRWRQTYLRNRYRREALVELSEIKQRLASGHYEAVRELAPLVKATAIAAIGREVAGLSDADYGQALADLAPGQPPLALADLQSLAYAPLEATKTIDSSSLISAIECWISAHRGPNA